jgi:hypothetical protein
VFELHDNALIIVRHHESDHLNQGVVETFISLRRLAALETASRSGTGIAASIRN